MCVCMCVCMCAEGVDVCISINMYGDCFGVLSFFCPILIPLTLLLNKEMTQKDDSSTIPQEERIEKRQKNRKRKKK